MKGRPQWEVLVGSTRLLDFLAGEETEILEHPLQKIMEEFVGTLSESEAELFHMRFGENIPIRVIARSLGYSSHQVVQVQLDKIIAKARRFLSERDTNTSNI